MNPGWEFIDSEKQAVTHPLTWAHPPASAFEKVTPDCYVKIGVRYPGQGGERFWCKVDSITEDGYEVTVTQNLECGHGLKDRDALVVKRGHVFGMITMRGGTIWEAPGIQQAHARYLSGVLNQAV